MAVLQHLVYPQFNGTALKGCDPEAKSHRQISLSLFAFWLTPIASWPHGWAGRERECNLEARRGTVSRISVEGASTNAVLWVQSRV